MSNGTSDVSINYDFPIFSSYFGVGINNKYYDIINKNILRNSQNTQSGLYYNNVHTPVRCRRDRTWRRF